MQGAVPTETGKLVSPVAANTHQLIPARAKEMRRAQATLPTTTYPP